MHTLTTGSPKVHTLHREEEASWPLEQRDSWHSPPLFLHRATGNWVSKARRTTRRSECWILMFASWYPISSGHRGPQINTYSSRDARAVESGEEDQRPIRVASVSLI